MADELPSLRVATCRDRIGSEAWPSPRDWQLARVISLQSWSGDPDPLCEAAGLATFQLLRDSEALFLRAEVPCRELNLNPELPTTKAHGLWNHDVVELFLSPRPDGVPYLEIEGSPLGQSLDYLIHEPRKVVDRGFQSGARVRGEMMGTGFRVEMAVPFETLCGRGQRPSEWRANVYVAQGAGEARRFWAWSPTRTAQPDFHVPSRFGRLRLAND